MTQVTVVMRTYERPVLLARALASVVQQTFADWELVVVNNGGNPATVDQVVATANPAGRHAMRVMHLPERVGMEEASNVALRESKASYFAIHDDDDSWDPHFLEAMVARFGENPGAAAVVCAQTRVHETMQGNRVWPVREEDDRLTPGKLTYRGMIGQNTFAPISALFRRGVLDTVGYFDASLPVLGDWEFNLRAVLDGGFAFEPRHLSRYHVRTPESDGATANTITAGLDRHMSVRAQLQDKWLREPEVNGVNKGLLSVMAQAIVLVEDSAGRGADPAQISATVMRDMQAQRPLRRVLRAVRHPRHGLRAITRRLGR